MINYLTKLDVDTPRNTKRNTLQKKEVLLMKWLKIIIPLISLLLTNAASAEFYKYYDEKGNVHFTDDYNKVPASQRQNVEEYQEHRSSNDESKATDTITENENMTVDRATAEKDKRGKKVDFGGELKLLDQRKAELAREYETLMQENAQLAAVKKSVKTKADADSYNERVRKLNESLKEHDRKRKEFFSDVEDYNTKVAKENKARTKTKSNPQ